MSIVAKSASTCADISKAPRAIGNKPVVRQVSAGSHSDDRQTDLWRRGHSALGQDSRAAHEPGAHARLCRSIVRRGGRARSGSVMGEGRAQAVTPAQFDTLRRTRRSAKQRADVAHNIRCRSAGVTGLTLTGVTARAAGCRYQDPALAPVLLR